MQDRKTGRLVKDKIPEVIRADGRAPVITVLTGQTLLDALDTLFLKEYHDYLVAPEPEDKVVALADMLEILLSTAHHLGTHEQELLQLCLKRRAQRGGFIKGYFYEGDKER